MLFDFEVYFKVRMIRIEWKWYRIIYKGIRIESLVINLIIKV